MIGNVSNPEIFFIFLILFSPETCQHVTLDILLSKMFNKKLHEKERNWTEKGVFNMRITEHIISTFLLDFIEGKFKTFLNDKLFSSQLTTKKQNLETHKI